MSEHEEHYDEEGTRLGFWLFLYTEFFLFAAFFLIYSVFRSQYLEGFQKASAMLSTPIGTVNTLVLLLSSLTVVLAIVAIKKDDPKAAIKYLVISIACGLVFLVVKGFEWNAKFSHDVFLSLQSTIDAGEASPLFAPGETRFGPGELMFFGLYFVMAGIHAFHIIIGLVLLALCYKWVKNKSINVNRPGQLENFGLYWHLVDVVWIFLFPLFYLIG